MKRAPGLSVLMIIFHFFYDLKVFGYNNINFNNISVDSINNYTSADQLINDAGGYLMDVNLSMKATEAEPIIRLNITCIKNSTLPHLPLNEICKVFTP